MATDAQVLDPNQWPFRVEGYTFNVLDATNKAIGTCTPAEGVVLTNDTTQTPMRRLSSFVLTPSDAAAIDPLSNRIQPVMRLPNGSLFPLGIFLYATASNHRRPWGVQREGDLGDLGVLLTQTLPGSLSFDSGTSITANLATVADMAGLSDTWIDASSATVGTPMSYVGSQSNTTFATVMAGLCTRAGFLAPYLLTSGQLRCRVAPNLATVKPTITYAEGSNLQTDSMVESNDLLTAPNRWKVIDSAATNSEIVGIYVLPASYPNSKDRRGFYITKPVQAAGLANTVAANAAAQAAAFAEPLAYETVSFNSPNDPRHDTFDVISYRGATYVELGWSMPLVEGGPMTHTVKRIYPV